MAAWEKKWDTVIPAVLKRLFVSGTYISRWSRKGKFCFAKPRGSMEKQLETRILHCSALKQTRHFSAVVGIKTPALWIECSIGGAENPGVCRSICLPLVNYT